VKQADQAAANETREPEEQCRLTGESHRRAALWRHLHGPDLLVDFDHRLLVGAADHVVHRKRSALEFDFDHHIDVDVLEDDEPLPEVPHCVDIWDGFHRSAGGSNYIRGQGRLGVHSGKARGCFRYVNFDQPKHGMSVPRGGSRVDGNSPTLGEWLVAIARHAFNLRRLALQVRCEPADNSRDGSRQGVKLPSG
jgi:hypothetical protein